MSKYDELKSLDIWKFIEDDVAWDSRFYLGYGIELTLYREKMFWHKTTCKEPIDLLTNARTRRDWVSGAGMRLMWKDVSIEDVLEDTCIEEHIRKKILFNINVFR